MQPILKNTITLGLGLGLCAQSLAFITSNPVSGQRNVEAHSYINNGIGGYCAGGCITNGAADTEAHWVVLVENRSALTAAPTAVETYQTSDTDVSAPSTAYNSNYFPTVGISVDVSPATTYTDWNFTTNEAGTITDGYIQTTIVDGGQTFVTVSDWTTKKTWGLAGCTVSFVSITEMRAWDVNNPTAAVPTGCTSVDTEVTLEYLSSVEVDTSKAVPVPAFAAAGLGLGLVAVTFLSSRKRQLS